MKTAATQRYEPTRAPPLPDVEPAGASDMELYTGRVHLDVEDVEMTVSAVTAYLEKSGAQIVAVDPNLIVARVHDERYEATLRGLDELGEVVERRSRALQNAASYATLDARRKTALVSRKKLEAVLGTARDDQSRRHLLAKIATVTEEIEVLSAQLAALEPHLVMATIHVVLS